MRTDLDAGGSGAFDASMLSKTGMPVEESLTSPSRSERLEKADYRAFEEAAHSLRAAFRSAKTGSVDIPCADLQQSTAAFSHWLKNLKNCIQCINALPEPGAERDPKIGQALLPFVMRCLAQGKPAGNDALLFDLYLRTHINPQTQKPQVISVPAFSGIQSHLSIMPDTSRLPGALPYLAQSEALSGKLVDINSRLSEKKEKLARNEELSAKIKSDKDPYGEVKNILRSAIKEIEAEIPKLFADLKDVQPESVLACVNALSVRASLSPAVLQKLIQAVKDLDRVLVMVLAPMAKGGGDVMKFSLPQISDDGKVASDNFSFNAAEREALRKNPAAIVNLIDTYLELRSSMRGLLPTLDPFRKLSDQRQALYECMQPPFAAHGARGERAIETLLHSADVQIKDATLRLLADKSATAIGAKPEWGWPLERKNSVKPLLWAVKEYINLAKTDAECPSLSVIELSDSLRENLSPFMRQVKMLCAKKDFAGLVSAASHKIEQVSGSQNIFGLLAPVLALSVVVEHKSLAVKLKNQIANIADIKDLAKSIGEHSEPLTKEVSDLVHGIIKGLSVSMSDFYGDPEMEELWEFLETFKIFLKNPGVVEGLAGNEAMRSGILVAGDPGVGKTFFVSCLANELNIPLLIISPEQGATSSQKRMIDACRKVIDDAKKLASAGKPCIVFIDEAEALMHNRDRPGITSDQIDLTCYLLQEINEIRVKYPTILIVAATNYPNKIDAGMFRDGRFDVQVYMGKPNPGMREAIIRDTLAREKLKLQLDTAQLEEFVAITDGMMPLTIKRTIFELNRIGKLLAHEAGKEFEMTFDLLRDRFNREKERRQVSLVERMARGLGEGTTTTPEAAQAAQ